MQVTNLKVSITKKGDGLISYKMNNKTYRVFIDLRDEVFKEVFLKYYNQLKTFKRRHYAIAKWIVRDLRNRGYLFKACKFNGQIIKPIKLK